jgi:hypothetical protein
MSTVLRFSWAASRLAIIFAVTAIASVARSGEVAIYEHYGSYRLDDPPPGMRPIILDVPGKFLYGSSKNAVATWGTNILTYYPSFTSPADPENKNYGLYCAGLCNGRILISVENRDHSVRSSSPNMGDFIARSSLKWAKTPPYPPNVHVRDLDSYDGFSTGFERVSTDSPGSAKGGASRFPWIDRFYFRKDRAPPRCHEGENKGPNKALPRRARRGLESNPRLRPVGLGGEAEQ